MEIEPEAYSLEWYRAAWPARKKIFIEREIKIRNAFHRNKLEPFILNDAQDVLLITSNEAFDDPTIEAVVLKCRRLGISTYYLADYLSDAIMESGHHVRIVAQDPDTLRTLLSNLKSMYTNLRPEIKALVKYNSKTEIEFDDEAKGVVDSRVSISAVAAGQEEKGRGNTFTRLHRTEVPFWKGDAETAAIALGDAAKGGKTSDESTAKGVGDFFHKEYQKGKLGLGGKRSHFFEWWWNRNYQIIGARFEQYEGIWYLLKPKQEYSRLSDEDRAKAKLSIYTKEEWKKREDIFLQSELDCAEAILAHLKIKGYVEADAQWHCDEVATCIAWRRQEIEKKGARKFRVEYPENDIDCFAATGGGIFDNSYIEITAKFRDAEPGHEYKIFLDPSNGVEGGDPYCITVHDCNTGEQVYEEGGIKKQDWQANRCCELSDQYRGAEIGIESNMGEAAILEVERLGYGHRLYRHISPDLEREIAEGKISFEDAWDKSKPGLPMTERLKRLVLNQLEKAWRTGDFRCASQVMCDEARVFVQTGNIMAAKSGYHDDSIMANAGCRFLVENSRVGSVSFASTGEKLGSAQLGGY
ncbi:MAG: hypothetical protein WBV94_00405 [Blastocatellia bacterium]